MSSEASKIAALEALLFVHGEPLTGDKIEKIYLGYFCFALC